MASRNPAPAPAVVLRSADDAVEVRYVPRGSSTSVMVTDVRTGDRAILDATELESLARSPGAELRRLLAEVSGEHQSGS
jgi:hypothetical protein